MIRSVRTAVPMAAALLATACASAPEPASPDPSPAGGIQPAGDPTPMAVYTEEQADRGQVVFRDTCSECHTRSEMHDSQFQFQWQRRSVGDLLTHISRTMPDDAPGTLSRQQYLDVVSYILRLNGFPSGSIELRADAEGLTMPLRIPSGG